MGRAIIILDEQIVPSNQMVYNSGVLPEVKKKDVYKEAVEYMLRNHGKLEREIVSLEG